MTPLYTVADIIEVADNVADHLIVEGSTERWVGLGAGWSEGRLTVRGDVAEEVGCLMRGGTIIVMGNARDSAGAGMIGGVLRIHGRAGNGVGGPLGESPMAGGLIVAEELGDRAGFAMQRGIIAAQRAGSELGLAMRAGTLVADEVRSVGRGVRRGSIITRHIDEWPDFFSEAGIVASSYQVLLGQHLSPYGFHWLAAARWPRRWVGDRDELNKGELWLCP
jgi:formylmethanofuran dehydrogenase subunit C